MSLWIFCLQTVHHMFWNKATHSGSQRSIFNTLREQLGKDLVNFTLETKAEDIIQTPRRNHSFHSVTSASLNIDASSSR